MLWRILACKGTQVLRLLRTPNPRRAALDFAGPKLSAVEDSGRSLLEESARKLASVKSVCPWPTPCQTRRGSQSLLGAAWSCLVQHFIPAPLRTRLSSQRRAAELCFTQGKRQHCSRNARRHLSGMGMRMPHVPRGASGPIRPLCSGPVRYAVSAIHLTNSLADRNSVSTFHRLARPLYYVLCHISTLCACTSWITQHGT